MYTLYSNLSEEEQQKKLKSFDSKYHDLVKSDQLCILCGMALHNCLCSHED